MKVCIPALGSDQSDEIDPKFGRCHYLHFIDTETLNGDCQKNLKRDGDHGVGIQVAQQILRQNIQVVICSEVGPNAMEVLESGGVQIYEGQRCSVAEAISLYRQNRLSAIGSD